MIVVEPEVVGGPAAGVETGGNGRPPGRGQREHILDTALRLMSEHGAGSTSMRQLAKACGLNVAAIYHYFPSKADIIRSVIEERQYGLQLSELPVTDVGLPPRELLIELIVEMWAGALQEERIWRLLLGEALVHDRTALVVGLELLDAIETALRTWLCQLFPDLEPRLDATVGVIMGQLYTSFIERLFRPEATDLATIRQRAVQIADAILL